MSSSGPSDSLTWLTDRIERAQSLERLAFLASLIKHATEDGEPWTRNNEAMSSLRKQWSAKHRQVKSQSRTHLNQYTHQ